MNVREGVGDVRTESLREHLVSENFGFGVIFEMPVTLETPFDYLSEFLGEGVVVEEVMDAKTRARGLSGIRGTDSFLSGADAEEIFSSMYNGFRCFSSPRSAEFNFL